MYQSYFRMKQRPFGATPQASDYFPTSGQEEAIATLRYAITQGRGIALLTGMPGTGKTLVCHRLAAELEPTFTTAMLINTNMTTVKGLLQAILYDLTLPYHGMDEQELRLTLTDFLTGKYAGGGRVALIIDEAQNLSVPLLEEIRMISNIEADTDRLLQIVLVGHPRLNQLLRRPELEALNQRIGARATLGSLTDQETFGYIRRQLEFSGVNPDRIFTQGAMEAIYEATAGVPRLVNQLGDHSLLLAYLSDAGNVDAEIVQQAHADLNLDHTDDQANARIGDPATGRISEPVTDRISEPVTSQFSDQVISAAPASGGRSAAEISETRVIEVSVFEPVPMPEPVRAELGHPLDEMFENEEVIVDQYASMDAAKAARNCAVPASRRIQPVAEQSQPAAPSIPTTRAQSETPKIATQSVVGGDVCTTLTVADDFAVSPDPFVDAADKPAVYEIGAGVEPQSATAGPLVGSEPSLLVIEERSKRVAGNRARFDVPQTGTKRTTGAYRRLFTHARKG